MASPRPSLTLPPSAPSLEKREGCMVTLPAGRQGRISDKYAWYSIDGN